jgi:PAS domain S-box-containing protein
MNPLDLLKEMAYGCPASTTGRDLFRLLAEHLSKALKVDYVFVGQILRNSTSAAADTTTAAETVYPGVFLVRGKEASGIEYSLADSLCACVGRSDFCAFPSRVQEQFPENPALKHFGVDGYARITLQGAWGAETGIVYVMHSAPLTDVTLTEYLLRITAKRVEQELVRMLGERQLLEANGNLRHQLDRRNKAEAELEEANAKLLQAQTQLVESNDQLEQRVSLRTEALHLATKRITSLLTRKKEARKEAENQRIQVETLLMQAPVAIAIYRLPGFVVELANEMICDIWGTTWDIVQGQPLFETLPHLLGTGYRERLESVLTTGEPYLGKELDIKRTRAGKPERMYLNLVHQPLPGTDGTIERIITVVTQVTEQVEARKKIEESEARLQRILRTIPDVIFSLDETLGQVQFVSPAASELLEVPLAQIYQHPTLLLQGFASTAREAAEVRAALAEKGHYSAQYRITTESGAERWIATRLWQREESLPEDKGKWRIDGISSDITQHKQAQFALEKREKRLSSLVESQTSFLIRTDLEGRYTFANNRFLEQYGFRYEELLGQLYFPTVHPEDIEKCQQMALQCITQPGKVVSLELRKIRGGRLYYTDWEFIGITDQMGEVAEIQGIGYDITVRRQIEQERQRLFEELTQQNQDLEQFAFITSHNLRAPVANMLGLVDIYNTDNLLDPVNLEVIERLRQSAQRLDGIIGDLNELLTVRKRQEEWQTMLFVQVLENVEPSIVQQIQQSKVQLVIDFTAAPIVHSVSSYVHSILLNLLSNALKYGSPARSLVVRVTSSREGSFVVLSVEDNGLGIDLERHREQLFGLYRRFHPHVAGKGLGLHLIKTQVEALGGKVEVESQEGYGSVFKVYFQQNDLPGQ